MLDVIKQVMEAEDTSARLVAAAQAEAQAYLADCRRRARELEEASARAAALEGERIVAAAVAEARRERDERIGRAVAGLQEELRLEEAAAGRVGAAIVRCVCGLGEP